MTERWREITLDEFRSLHPEKESELMRELRGDARFSFHGVKLFVGLDGSVTMDAPTERYPWVWCPRRECWTL